MTQTCAISYTYHSTADFNADREAELAADHLGMLLFDTPEFQNYSRMISLANQDPEVKNLRYQIRDQENNYVYYEGDQPDVDDLTAQLEAHPKMIAMRQAESELRRLFCQVDALISAAAQAPFAHYARAGHG